VTHPITSPIAEHRVDCRDSSRAKVRAVRGAITALLLFPLMLPSSAAGQVGPPPGFDAYVQDVMARFEVPGLSVAIVKDGEVVLAKGYGVRRLGSSPSVDASTLFGIASNTKVFTATALGILVEEGKLEWDAPVVRYLPSFQMYDPWVTRHITVRDLLVHRSGLGLGAGDLMFWPPTTFTRPELVERLRYIPPATSFRSTYAYDNVLYPVAGEVIAAVSGMSWEDFVATRILAPVGMVGSDVRLTHPEAVPNAAMTHRGRVAGLRSRRHTRSVEACHPDPVRRSPAGTRASTPRLSVLCTRVGGEGLPRTADVHPYRRAPGLFVAGLVHA